MSLRVLTLCPIPNKNSSSATPRAESYDSLIGSDKEIGHKHQIIWEDYLKYGYASTAKDGRPLPGCIFCLAVPANEIRNTFNHSKLV